MVDGCTEIIGICEVEKARLFPTDGDARLARKEWWAGDPARTARKTLQWVSECCREE